MSLSKTALKTLVIMFSCQIVIVTTSALIYNPLIQSERNFHSTIRAKGELNQLIRQLKNNHNKHLEKFVKRNIRPWLEVSISKTSKYKKINLTVLKRYLQLPPPIKASKFSINFDKNKYLNIVVKNPPKRFLPSLALISLMTICFLALFIISFWAIKRLNAPIVKLTENLDYANQNKQWQPLPLLGDQEQNLIFEKINQLHENINKLFEDKTHMLTAISHDLRTPLTRIRLRAEYFENNDQHPKLLNDIDEMELMISESLNYFKNNNYAEKIQSFDLITLLEVIIEDCHTENSKIIFDSKINKLAIDGRFNLLKRAFTNLISNSIKYGTNSTINLSKTTNFIEININDTGPGIDKSKLDKVFKPFYRVENSRSRSTGGSGLGLTIAKEIIQLHDGQINLINRDKGGLSVIVKMPIKKNNT